MRTSELKEPLVFADIGKNDNGADTRSFPQADANRFGFDVSCLHRYIVCADVGQERLSPDLLAEVFAICGGCVSRSVISIYEVRYRVSTKL